MMFLSVLEFIKCLWEFIGLLSNYHNMTHVLHYIKGTIKYRITYGRNNKDIWPISYIDADYGGDLDDCHSCSRHIFVQAGGPTSWGIQYQPTVALSTMETKYMALTRAMKQILWMYLAMDEVGYPQPHPAILWNDNAGAVLLSKNTKLNVRVKHIDIHYHYIHNCISDGNINIHHLPSTENLADMLTKQLPWVMHERHCLSLHLHDPKVPVSARGSVVNKG